MAEVTGLDRFSMLRGAELLACAGDGSPIDGFLEVAKQESWSVIPAVSLSAMPSGPVADAVFEAFWTVLAAFQAAVLADRRSSRLRGAISGRSGSRGRAASDPVRSELPLFFGVFGHATARMAMNANCLVAYASLTQTRITSPGRVHRPCLREDRLPRIEYAAACSLPPTGTGTAVHNVELDLADDRGNDQTSGRSMPSWGSRLRTSTTPASAFCGDTGKALGRWQPRRLLPRPLS